MLFAKIVIGCPVLIVRAPLLLKVPIVPLPVTTVPAAFRVSELPVKPLTVLPPRFMFPPLLAVRDKEFPKSERELLMEISPAAAMERLVELIPIEPPLSVNVYVEDWLSAIGKAELIVTLPAWLLTVPPPLMVADPVALRVTLE